MYNGYKIIDADAHIHEPHDLWSDYMEAESTTTGVPWSRRGEEGKRHSSSKQYLPCELFPEGLYLPGAPSRAPARSGRSSAARSSWARSTATAWYAEFSPESRVVDMDRYGWDKQVMIDNFPHAHAPHLRGRRPGASSGPAHGAYNNWSYDFAQAGPTKLKVSGVLPNQHDIEGADHRDPPHHREAGRRHHVAVPTPDKGKAWHDPEYDGFWALAEELDFPMSFHGVNSGDPHVGTRYKPRHLVSGQEVALEHALGFSVENMISLGHMIFLGILQKFPKMRISLLEGNAGWLPFWLGRLDDHCLRNKRQGMWFDSEGPAVESPASTSSGRASWPATRTSSA